MDNNYVFSPYMGKESIVLQQDKKDGSLYFTTDTRRIYLDTKDQSKLPVGGNVELFYGKMTLDSPPVDGQTEFSFNIIDDIVGNDIEGQLVLIPRVNDLILNQDGCFYKVIELSEDQTLTAEKLTIAGTGGGGNNSSNSDSLAGMGMSRLRADNGNTLLYQSSCPISFAVKVTDDLGDPELGIVGTYDVYIDNVKRASGSVKGCSVETSVKEFNKLDLDTVASEELNTVDVGSYLPLKESITVKISVNTIDGRTSTRSIVVSITNMALTWEYAETTINHYNSANRDMTLSWSVSGDFEKTTHIIIDDDYQNEIMITNSSVSQSYVLDFMERNLNHGAHKVEMYATASFGGGLARTPSTFKNIIIVEDTSLSTIISIGLFEKELTQYDTVKIPIFIYDPSNVNGGTSIVTLKENNESRDIWTDVENLDTSRFWSYTPTLSGDVVLMVSCNGTDKSIIVTVNPLGIDISEVGGYAFKFKANEFPSNDSIKNWSNNGVRAIFPDSFDWINGGLGSENDENGNNRQFMKIKAGSSMEINYPIFKTDPKTGLGKCIKIIFKAINCRDYDASVLSCKIDKKVPNIMNDDGEEIYFVLDNGINITYAKEGVSVDGDHLVMHSPEEGVFDLTSSESRTLFDKKYVEIDGKIYQCNISKTSNSTAENPKFYAYFYEAYVEDTFEGLLLRAQNAIYKSRNQTLSTQYCEDSYIELELDITKRDEGDIKNYITFWIDGVPSGYVVYDGSDEFTLNSNPVISIGSADCDVQIYTIKVYEKSLTNEEHLKNFIADAPGAAEMISRFRRNDILDGKKEISPSLLSKANPDCLVHIYEIDQMTTAKSHEVPGCLYQQYKDSDKAILTADNVTIKVQGTSSEKYVVAAANLDTKFNNGFDDAKGNHLDGWEMAPGAIPVDFTCTKVNVASCENANNAMNQEWYNMFQPYKTVLRCKNPNARDTMQFTNGVIFIKDNNQTFDKSGEAKENNIFGDTSGYLSNPYPKMYSLGQMGNSKDNIEVFHDTTNPLECCVEVNDNQEPQQWMVNDNYLDSDIDGGKKYYGFRYPSKLKGLSDDDKKNKREAWKRFVSWMAHSNPQPKYEEHKATNELEYRKFSYNQKQGISVDVYVLNEDRTEYNKIDEFNPDIDTYYTLTENIYGYTNLPLDEPVSFEPHTFGAYYSNREIQQSQYTPLIAGCTVSQYATKKVVYDPVLDDDGNPTYDNDGNPIYDMSSAREENVPYTRDTYQYRMAKMLSECEEYLCMDSVIYHYLFIERHCMIDNVAKNTFWSTEDGRVWNLTKDYDNDTADGNDNNGKFTRSYGMEPMDKLNANTYVFNARQSVWFNFIAGLQEACEHMYQALENTIVTIDKRPLRVWDKDDYLWLFNRWQSKIPERCWIEDYYRKYRRPYELYNDNMYNSMMEGGQKKHQRKQFETYQEIYMASKYFGTACRNSYSIIRGNGKDISNHQLPITTYSDCYIHAHVGSARSVQRVKRNEINYLTCPVGNINNATIYFYPANTFSTIGSVNGGQIDAYEPEQISFSEAHKLRELVISSDRDNAIPNSSLTQGLSIGNNKLLEKLYVANFTSYGSDLNLMHCPNLQELDASNSTFTAITLADGAPVQNIKLYNPSSLTFSNLRQVNSLSIEDQSRLSILNLKNIDSSPGLNSKNLVDSSRALMNYKLIDVDWIINSNVDNKEIEGTQIKTLEFLLSKSPTSGGSREASLTGDLEITQNGYNIGQDGALAIYENYAKSSSTYEQVFYANEEAFNKDKRDKFIQDGDNYILIREYNVDKDYYVEKIIPAKYPNLNITFSGDKAKLYTVYIYDGDGNVFWKRKAKTGTTIDLEFLKYGPDGWFKSSSLYKAKTEEYEYNFLNSWTIKAPGKADVSLNSAEPIGITVSDTDIHLYPDFEESPRQYNITVKLKHPETNEITQLRAGSYRYGTPLKDTFPQDTIPSVESDSLPLAQVYDFIGYSLVDGSTTLVSDSATVKNDATLWAVFEIKSVYDAVHPEWFSYQELGNGECSILPAENMYLKGKVVLPLESPRGQKVVSISGFGYDRLESKGDPLYIFLQEGNLIRTISYGAFSQNLDLKYFDFENAKNLTTIENSAFYLCKCLESLDLSNTKITTVGGAAFNQAFFATPDNNTLILPHTLLDLSEYSFAIMFVSNTTPLGNNSYLQLQIGTVDNLARLEFVHSTTEAFRQNPEHLYHDITIYSSGAQSKTDIVNYFLNWVVDSSNIHVVEGRSND